MSTLINKALNVTMIRWVFWTVLLVSGSLLIGTLAASPGMIRLLFFVGFIMVLAAFNKKEPKLVLYILLLYLPFMGFFRRVLIPVAGWNAFDPLVVVAPVTVLLLGSGWVYRTYIARDLPIEDDTRLFRLVRALLVIHLIQVFNPLQGGLLTGFGGIIFYIVPVLWMVFSRKYFNEQWMKIIFATVLCIGIVSALYGLKQTFLGFYDFEEQWIRMGGYAALIVGTGSRSFSFFTSAQEYSQFLIIGVVISWAYVLKGKFHAKLIGLMAIPLLVYALFMIGSRSPIVMTAVTLAILSVLSVRHLLARFIILAAALAALALSYSAITQLDPDTNALIAHQVNGLSNPLDSEHSTLQLHTRMVIDGLMQGITLPIGRGLGSTTLAGAKLGSDGGNSEVDLSNIMMSDGIIGGVIYLLLMIQVIRLVLAADRNSAVNLSILGILISTFGGWSLGGNYSTCALIWLCIGYLDMHMKNHRYNQLNKGERHAKAYKTADSEPGS